MCDMSKTERERLSLEEAMTAKDARDRGILNAFGILRSPTNSTPSFKVSAPIYAFNGGPSSFDRPYVFGAQPHHSKPPHTDEGIAGRLSANVNSKPPHTDEGIAGSLSANVNSKPPHTDEGISGSLSVNVNSKTPHTAEGISG